MTEPDPRLSRDFAVFNHHRDNYDQAEIFEKLADLKPGVYHLTQYTRTGESANITRQRGQIEPVFSFGYSNNDVVFMHCPNAHTLDLTSDLQKSAKDVGSDVFFSVLTHEDNHRS